jgi:hypothetical protein
MTNSLPQGAHCEFDHWQHHHLDRDHIARRDAGAADGQDRNRLLRTAEILGLIG